MLIGSCLRCSIEKFNAYLETDEGKKWLKEREEMNKYWNEKSPHITT
jgi:hypothetical protein